MYLPRMSVGCGPDRALRDYQSSGGGHKHWTLYCVRDPPLSGGEAPGNYEQLHIVHTCIYQIASS